MKKIGAKFLSGLFKKRHGGFRLGVDCDGMPDLWTMGDFEVVLPAVGMTIRDRVPWTCEVVAIGDCFLATDGVTMVVVSASACRSDVRRSAKSEFSWWAENGLGKAMESAGDAGLIVFDSGLEEGWRNSIEKPCPCMGRDASCLQCRRTGQVNEGAEINGQVFSGAVVGTLKRWKASIYSAPHPARPVPQPFHFLGGFGFVMPMKSKEA